MKREIAMIAFVLLGMGMNSARRLIWEKRYKPVKT